MTDLECNEDKDEAGDNNYCDEYEDSHEDKENRECRIWENVGSGEEDENEDTC